MNTLSHRTFTLLSGAWRRRYVIALPIILLPILGLFVGIFSPKQYTSHTSMLVQETAKMNPFLEDLAVSSKLKERMAALQTLLHSRHILGAVAQERGYITDETTPAKHDEIIANLSSSLSVKLAGKDLIRIDLNAENPDGMKETLEAVSQHFTDQLLAPERSSMKDSSYFLSEQLQRRRIDLDNSENALAVFKDKHRAELPELHLSNMTRLAQLKQRLSERQAELAGAQKSLGGLDNQLSKTNPVVGKIEEQIVRLRSQLALLKTRYTDQHSKVQTVLYELKRLEDERQQVISTTQNIVGTEQLWDIASSRSVSMNDQVQPLLVSQLKNLQLAQSKVEALKEETNSLQSMINQLEEQTQAFGQHERELIRLQRDLDVKRELYKDLLQRHEMARVTGSLSIFEQEKRIKVIDRPYTPVTPSNLPLVFFILAGLFGGLFLGIGVAFVLELTDTTLRTREQILQMTGLAVISRIPPIAMNKEELS